MKKNILILGASGFVGKNLVNILKHKYNITFVSGKNELDLKKKIV